MLHLLGSPRDLSQGRMSLPRPCWANIRLLHWWHARAGHSRALVRRKHIWRGVWRADHLSPWRNGLTRRARLRLLSWLLLRKLLLRLLLTLLDLLRLLPGLLLPLSRLLWLTWLLRVHHLLAWLARLLPWLLLLLLHLRLLLSDHLIPHLNVSLLLLDLLQEHCPLLLVHGLQHVTLLLCQLNGVSDLSTRRRLG